MNFPIIDDEANPTNILKPNKIRGPISWKAGFIHSKEEPLLLHMGILVAYHQFQSTFKRVEDANARTNRVIESPNGESFPKPERISVIKFKHNPAGGTFNDQMELEFSIQPLFIHGHFWKYVPCLPTLQISILKNLELMEHKNGESIFYDGNLSKSNS